jgi:hypothetical protein
VHKRGWIQKRPTVVTKIRREGTKRLGEGTRSCAWGLPRRSQQLRLAGQVEQQGATFVPFISRTPKRSLRVALQEPLGNEMQPARWMPAHRVHEASEVQHVDTLTRRR